MRMAEAMRRKDTCNRIKKNGTKLDNLLYNCDFINKRRGFISKLDQIPKIILLAWSE